MIGNLESSLEKFEKELDDIIEKIGISYVKDEESIETLKLSYEKLSKMHHQECCILSYKLQQYGLYLQSVYNRLNNIKNWCDANLSKIVGKYSKQYDSYTKYDEKKFNIIAENSYAEALMKMSIKSGSKASELYGVVQRVNNMANTLLELSKSKRVNYNG